MWCHLYQCHVMLMASSMTPLHSLGQDNWNKVQNEMFGHVTSLVLVSHDVDGIINGTIPFLWSRWSKWGAGFSSYDTIGVHLSITWCQWHFQLHSLAQDDQNEVQYDFFVYVIPLALLLASSMTAFFTSWQLKWGASWIVWSCNTIGISVGVTWYHWHHVT